MRKKAAIQIASPLVTEWLYAQKPWLYPCHIILSLFMFMWCSILPDKKIHIHVVITGGVVAMDEDELCYT